MEALFLSQKRRDERGEGQKLSEEELYSAGASAYRAALLLTGGDVQRLGPGMTEQILNAKILTEITSGELRMHVFVEKDVPALSAAVSTTQNGGLLVGPVYVYSKQIDWRRALLLCGMLRPSNFTVSVTKDRSALCRPA
ncbi:MAG: hypothetical protein KGI04_03475 [Candidatus Micrarchaeota archaeon]|nr:hypothetical protein [Candidatus Micrarchaeota archaeon]